MQRLYSTFPSSGPGVALVLLRGCVSALFVLDAWARLPVDACAWCVGAGALGMALALGAATPLACLACGLAEVALGLALQHGTLLGALVLVQAVSLGLLGPGAYSVDGLLFGRRRLVWPQR